LGRWGWETKDWWSYKEQSQKSISE
jgi:hypothetical protein